MIRDRVPCRKFIQKVPVWIKFTTNDVILMCTKDLSLPASDAVKSRKYESLVQQPENSLTLADWLKEGGCEMVAMESTVSYWEPLYNILESSDLNAIVVNARHMKAVPGRKTDVKDAEWIADLLQPTSYIPAKDQRELRELVRYRKSLVGERTRELNRLQKMLEGANIKLSGTVSDINGKSARSILEYLLTGEDY